MANISPYRSLPPERRVALVLHAIRSGREGRDLYIQRLSARNGFRPITLQSWPAERLAAEVVRTKAETPHDELDLLHRLYVEIDPAIQVTFLDAAGVPHERGAMSEGLSSPYADAPAVARGADAVRTQHGEEGMRYLRTLVRYARADWPGIESAVDV